MPFPDGAPPEQSTWITRGIEAFQVAGKPVGAEVRATTVERVAAACKRLGLDMHAVLAHRDIDPARRSDPVGVEIDAFRADVARTMLEDMLPLQPAVQNPVIQLNPEAALQKRILADGFEPNSPEFALQVQAVQYVAQRAEHLQTGKVRAYYAKSGDWEHVEFVERG